MGHPPILASKSATRRQMLDSAGVAFDAHSADVDEAAIKEICRAGGLDAPATALKLAEAKAAAIGARFPGRVVIGADQMLDCGGVWFDKPADMAAAADQLRHLRGRMHELPTAVVCWRDGVVLWRHVETPRLTLHAFTEAELASVLAAEGDRLLDSVGAYRVEGPAIRLFQAIEGDWFSILGLPLLPLLGFLRRQ
ncbi:Maf family protein [Acidisoma silvae]|uniref:Nucleoside triphosphate pyrophosphatase n=1 Tax=Acidisoma silvae TaxID=2802396 RepID=A0A963YPI1_9PROT|nr:Maf family protein [Acidisoma silvae]MCB8874347.1 Maf family protein [Acidisoma silvae]